MKRPLSVTLIGYLFILAGVFGIIYHATELKDASTRTEVIWILLIRLFAIIGGAFTLRGFNWARWLSLAWIIYHVVLSSFHTTTELIIHIIFMVIIAIALFHPRANQYFRG